MIAKIIPKVKLPRQFTTFDYLVPKELEGRVKVGQVVEAEFRKTKTEGLVMEVKSQKSKVKSQKFDLKPIIKILTEKPMLYPEQMRALEWISKYYYTPLSLVFKTFIPDIPKTQKHPPALLCNALRAGKNTRLPCYAMHCGQAKTRKQSDFKLAVLKSRLPAIKRSLEEIIKSPKSTLFFWNDLREKILVYIKLIEYCLKKKQQILIILPQITDIEFLSGYLEPRFGAKMTTLHAGLSKTEQYQNWLKVLSSRAKVILGTRSAILAPLKNPGLIIIDDEQAPDHKQSDQNPRYDARTIAQQLKTKIVFSSASPRVESYYEAKTKESAQVDLSAISYDSYDSRISNISHVSNIPHLIDMHQEFQKGNYTPISDALEDAIKQTLNQNQKVFLFLNRKGQARMVVCKDCQFLFQCPKCQLPLTHHETEKQLICHQCNYRSPSPIDCSKCQGQNLKFVGTGTQKVEKEIKEKFPRSKVIRVDKDTHYYRLEIDKYDIIIGTQFFLKNFPTLKNLGLCGVVSSDTLLYRPDFRASEKTYSLITKILTWARFNKANQVIFQTYLKNQPVITNAATQNYEVFYQNEIRARKQLGYPPFVKLIKLIHKDENQNQGLRTASSLVYGLKRIRSVQVFGPLIPTPPRTGKSYIHQIIIKIPSNQFSSLAPTLDKLIPPNFLIDIEPEELL